MNLLIVTQYYPPEVGAPQNRLHELAIRLSKKGVHIAILTAMPNYPQMEIYPSYKGKFFYSEILDDVKIYRAYIFVTKNKALIFRMLNYFSFVFSSFFASFFLKKRFDYVFCESPPLFLGISAYIISKIKNCRLIFNVSDLWPESAEKLGLVKNNFMLRAATILEEFMYRKSFLITCQTQGIVKNISNRFPKKNIYWLKNGVDIEYFKNHKPQNWRHQHGFFEDDFILLYAGIIGHAQKLETILEAANNLKNHEKIKFVLFGNGPEKEKLLNLKTELNLTNLFFYDVIPKCNMPEIIQSIDTAIIPLRKLDLFKGAIPSKIFEILATRKPILLGVDGEARTLFIDEGTAGLYFEPENVDELVKQILLLYSDRKLLAQLGENGKNYVNENFNRDKIADDFWKKLVI